MQDQSKILISSLASELCPACGRVKRQRNTFCFPCYRSLPRPMQTDLHCRVGEGYERAFQAAISYLEVETPIFPQEPA